MQGPALQDPRPIGAHGEGRSHLAVARDQEPIECQFKKVNIFGAIISELIIRCILVHSITRTDGVGDNGDEDDSIKSGSF